MYHCLRVTVLEIKLLLFQQPYSLVAYVLDIFSNLIGSLLLLVNMLRTDCKLDQFVNGPPVYKPVIQFFNWLARFQ